jgi:3-deoxy-D-manno-octulosonic-acid transferase
LYNFVIQCYYAGISIAALWSKKAAQWKQGRKNLCAELEQTFSNAHNVVWIHSASAGEFEQAKPVIEALKKAFPHYEILVTFFSPSGYPAGKRFSLADYVFYMPLDTAGHASRFLNLVQPKLVLFIKYDFWYHHLKEVHKRKIPLLLVSALFRKDQVFFQWYGKFQLRLLHFFTRLFVQDEASYGLLKKFRVNQCTVSGDTRFDRVLTIVGNFQPVPFIDHFVQERKTIVAGSTWPEDEERLHEVLKKFGGVKLIIAPHEVDTAHVDSIARLFQNSIRYSGLQSAAPEVVQASLAKADVLIIDNVGLLSRLYRYATVTYVGGGFNRSGIHNTLEAAVFGKPVLFGPNYKKFREARELIGCGAAFSFASEAELASRLEDILGNEDVLQKSSAAAVDYVRNNGGATQMVITYIQEKRLLTN